MDVTGQIHSELPKGFWDSYIERLQKQCVKPKVLRWYVVRAEQFSRLTAIRNSASFNLRT